MCCIEVRDAVHVPVPASMQATGLAMLGLRRSDFAPGRTVLHCSPSLLSPSSPLSLFPCNPLTPFSTHLPPSPSCPRPLCHTLLQCDLKSLEPRIRSAHAINLTHCYTQAPLPRVHTLRLRPTPMPSDQPMPRSIAMPNSSMGIASYACTQWGIGGKGCGEGEAGSNIFQS